MKTSGVAFDPVTYARIRAYNDQTGRELRAVPVTRDERGVYTCEPLRENEWQIGMEWDQPRDVRGVQVLFEEDSPVPADWHAEYWHFSWPNEQKDRRVGAHKGWLLTDDPFHGRWLAAYGEQTLNAAGCAVLFDHMDVNEVLCLGGDYPQNLFLSDDYNAMFRRTLKLRVVFSAAEAPRIRQIRLTGDATVREDACRVYPNATGRGETAGPVRIEAIWNGEFISGQGVAQRGATLAYRRTVGARTDADQTVITFRAGDTGFGVRAEDVETGVYMEDFDLLIVPDEMQGTPEDIVKRLTLGKQSIFDRVAVHAEQSVENAMAEIPAMVKTMQPKYGRYVPMGWIGVRQKFALRYNGDIFASKIDQKVSARDTARTHWAGNELHFRLASGDPPNRHEGNEDTTQSMPDPRVPVYHTQWLDRDVEYRQTTFATLVQTEREAVAGDEDIMVMNRVQLRNASSEERLAQLLIESFPGEQLRLQNDALLACGRVRPGDTPDVGWTVQPYPEPYLRAQIRINGKGELRCIPFTAAGTTSLSMQPQFGFEGYDRNPVRQPPPSCVPTTLLYEVRLAPYATHVMDLILPYPSFSREAEWEQLRARGFDTELTRVREHWLEYAAKGARLSLPGEKKLNDFAQAVPWHVALSVMRDLRTGLYMVPAGTYGYGACGNEASLQIRMLDYLGYHEDAEKYLETFVVSQGTGSMDGNFQSNGGALVANNYAGYSDRAASLFAYNLDHGYILSCLVDHYRLTGNRQWLQHVSETLVRACDYIFTERRATMIRKEDGEKVSYYGLMPHGHLEDNPEWRCWYAVNAQACGGMLAAAEALGEMDHPQADRIRESAQAYREDIRDSVRRAMANSPAVPTGNGGYMPHIPTQAEIRGRDWGWFREVAYGPLHLASCGVLQPDEPMTTWILRDQEDNLFLSRDYGRAVDRERYWFSRGGMTIQSNLLFNDQVYLQRGERARAIRTLFNNFAQNLYRDVNCFTEHPITDFGLGFGPFFKTPDESQFIVNLRNHLLREESDTLVLLQGAPRAWLAAGATIRLERMATYFGPVSCTVRAEEYRLEATVTAQWRGAPAEIRLHLRTPQTRQPIRMELNGAMLADAVLKDEVIRLQQPPNVFTLRLFY